MLTLALILLCAGLSSSRNLKKGKFFIAKVFFTIFLTSSQKYMFKDYFNDLKSGNGNF